MKNTIQIRNVKYLSLLTMFTKKKLNLVVTELFISGRKLTTSLVFVMQSYFALPKNIRLNSKDYLWKSQTKNFNKFHLIIHEILTLKTLWIFTKRIEDQGKKQIKAIEEHGKQLVKLMHVLKKKKVYYMISKRKYYVILLQKEQEKLKNYIIVFIFKIWYIVLRVPLKI